MRIPGPDAPVIHSRHGLKFPYSTAAQNSITQNPDTLQRYPLSSITGATDGAGVMVEHIQSAESFHADYQAVSDPAGRCYFSSGYVSFPVIFSTLI